MFRPIGNRSVCKNIATVLSAGCSTRSTITLKKEINRVTLIGAVGMQYQMNNGHKFIEIRTMGEGVTRSQIHQLYTAISKDFEAGQRVLVGGSLSSKSIITPENKVLSQPIIQAFQIYPLTRSLTEDDTKSNHLNFVELLASVCTNVTNKDNHSIMRVATHYLHKSTPEIRPNFHTIFVFDQDLCEILRKNGLEKGDRIYVTGYLSGNTHTYADGKKSHSGFIVAQSIDKITKFDRNQLAQQESQESANADTFTM